MKLCFTRTLPGVAVLGILLLLGTSPGHAIPYTFTATLNGTSENPSNSSPGTGVAVLFVTGNLLALNVTFSGLEGTTTVATMHCCTAPPNNISLAMPPLPGFPTGVTSGTYSSPTFDTSFALTYTSTFINNFGGGTVPGAEAALLAGLLAGEAYFNIHTFNSDPLKDHPGGEIRGFFVQSVPEPDTLLLFGAGLVGLAAWRWKRAA